MSTKDKLLRWLAGADRWLKKVLGEENEIFYHFARLLLIVALLALLVGAVVWVVSLIFHAVATVVAAFIAAAPYLLAIALVAGVGTLSFYLYRKRRERRRADKTPPKAQAQPEAQAPAETPPPSPPQAPADARPTSDDERLRQALRCADEATRSSLQSVLVSLQRFDHRLELVITPAHYTDLFGDNWAHVRQFVESPQGRSVAAVSVMLVEIMILYKRAQEVRWVPINDERIRAWWNEAARRRRWLADTFEAAARPEATDGADNSSATDTYSLSPAEVETSAAPTFNSPPSLDDLLRYYNWISRESSSAG